MEKYKFKITKTKESLIEIEAKDKKEAVKKLAGYLATNNKLFCKKISKGRKGFYIFLNEICSETRQTIIDDYDEINQDIIKYLLSEDKESLKEYNEIFSKKYENYKEDFSKNKTENEKNISKNDEEIEDDLPKEYTEICCEKCR